MFDVILCNPKDVYYPWSMECLNKNRDIFGRVIIMMTQQNNKEDYTEEIKSRGDNFIVVSDYEDDGHDWRNAALNRAVKDTRNDVLFLEQDFLVKDGFFQALAQVKGYNAIGFRDGNRFHPACLLVTREALFRTQRDFSVTKDVGDHFSKFTTEIEAMGDWVDLETLGLPEHFHLSGLTQNYRLESNWHHPGPFYEYNCLSQELPQPESWREICKVKQEQMGGITPDEKIRKFFV